MEYKSGPAGPPTHTRRQNAWGINVAEPGGTQVRPSDTFVSEKNPQRKE